MTVFGAWSPLPVGDNLVVAVAFVVGDEGVGRQVGGTCAAADGQHEVGLYADFVPQVLHEERLQCLGTALDDERLDVVGVQAVKVQRVGAVYDQPLRTVAPPVADGQLRMLALLGHTAHEDGILLGAQLVGEHLREG